MPPIQPNNFKWSYKHLFLLLGAPCIVALALFIYNSSSKSMLENFNVLSEQANQLTTKDPYVIALYEQNKAQREQVIKLTEQIRILESSTQEELKTTSQSTNKTGDFYKIIEQLQLQLKNKEALLVNKSLKYNKLSKEFQEQQSTWLKYRNESETLFQEISKRNAELENILEIQQRENIALLQLQENAHPLDIGENYQIQTYKALKQQNQLLFTQLEALRGYREKYLREFEIRKQREEQLSQLQEGSLPEIQTQLHTNSNKANKINLAKLPYKVLKESVKRIHIASDGDSLNSIAAYYYGDEQKWKQIYETNYPLISDLSHVKAGTILVIP
ncbi:MAG: hypothetical protein K0S74_719 [Chlamydiales bacterium]|jgi:hypothetical protein|nr:hypothetical protein [Chlamydiales bacterium]